MTYNKVCEEALKRIGCTPEQIEQLRGVYGDLANVLPRAKKHNAGSLTCPENLVEPLIEGYKSVFIRKIKSFQRSRN